MKNSITFEIQGTGVHNRGAELMAISVIEKVREKFPNCRVVVKPNFGNYLDRAKYQLYSTNEPDGRFVGKFFGKLSPRSFKDAYGIVNPSEIDFILNASGFLFSDQWRKEDMLQIVNSVEKNNRARAHLIMLPQAFGPFKKDITCTLTKRILDRSSLVYARDFESLKHLNELNVSSKQKYSPDFTIGTKPKIDNSIVLPEKFAAIIPNNKLFEGFTNKKSYIEFAAILLEKIRNLNMEPVIIFHDPYDVSIVREFPDDFREVIKIRNDDPLVLKAILGKAEIVFGSRYHALVSSLSQSIPSVAIGWSHKYPTLLEDFNISKLQIKNIGNLNEINEVINYLNTKEKIDNIRACIRSATVEIQQSITAMWDEVFEFINNSME